MKLPAAIAEKAADTRAAPRIYPEKPKVEKVEPTRTYRGAVYDNIDRLLQAAAVLARAAGYEHTIRYAEGARETLAVEFDSSERRRG